MFQVSREKGGGGSTGAKVWEGDGENDRTVIEEKP